MKCLKCDGELHPILKDGQSYAQCDKCGRLFTRHDLKYSAPTPQPQSSRPVEAEPDDDDGYYTMGLPTAIVGWILCALFLMFGLVSGSVLPLIAFIAAAVLVSPLFRNHVYLSGKVWIPLVVVLAVAGFATTPLQDTQSEKIAQKQEAPSPAPKQSKAAVKEQDEEDTEEQQAAKEKEEAERAAQEQAEREEQERLAQEQAEQERIAQEQAAAQAEQERIAQEQAAAQAEQERIAQEQAAAAQAEQQRLEQERIAQEQAAAQQAEQERIAQEQAAAVQANAGQNPFNTYNNPEQQQTTSNYVLNTNTKKFHYPHCNDVKRIAPHNYSEFNGTREEAIAQGYSSCGHCNP